MVVDLKLVKKPQLVVKEDLDLPKEREAIEVKDPVLLEKVMVIHIHVDQLKIMSLIQMEDFMQQVKEQMFLWHKQSMVLVMMELI